MAAGGLEQLLDFLSRAPQFGVQTLRSPLPSSTDATRPHALPGSKHDGRIKKQSTGTDKWQWEDPSVPGTRRGGRGEGGVAPF
jgi:hypothetical protein